MNRFSSCHFVSYVVEEKADKDQSNLITDWKQIYKGQMASGETVGHHPVVLDKHTLLSHFILFSVYFL